jgi:hypothetical protein
MEPIAALVAFIADPLTVLIGLISTGSGPSIKRATP